MQAAQLSHALTKPEVLIIAAGAAAAAAALTLLVTRKASSSSSPVTSLVLDEAGALSKEEVLALRRKYFCAAQSVSYSNSTPLLVVRGSMQYLWDEKGRRYLDTRNNVGHVGWQHPAVHAAVSQQLSLTNSNTRYLHPNVVLLAKRLAATLPDPLSVCFFVNSGSEANDLALRLARAHTKKNDVVVLDHGYHGHTASVIDISPYKFDHTGGEGAKPWVHKVACPDMYRGRHRDKSPEEASRLYADEVKRAVERSKPAAIFVESGMSVAGVILPPPGYMAAAFKHVRNAGGVCVADEVQTGFGRTGSHFWAFEQNGEGATPDIVTMGKPFGNGLPLAAVVTTPAIAGSFCNGMEYFNTFGGNPVSCAAGLAVLRVIESENLQAKAKRTGEHLASRICDEFRLTTVEVRPDGHMSPRAHARDYARAFAARKWDAATGAGEGGGEREDHPIVTKAAEIARHRHEAQKEAKAKALRESNPSNTPGAQAGVWVGDLRGSGLFIGIEFVTDRATRAPATAHTSLLCSRLKSDWSILTSIDGPHNNVLVVKPPLCFSPADADTFLDAVKVVLSKMTIAEVKSHTHTPT